MEISKTVKIVGLTTAIVTLVATIGSYGWWAANNLATADDVNNIEAKYTTLKLVSNYMIDQHIAALVAQVSRLEAKRGKTAADIEQIRYLRAEIQRLRDIKTKG